jgi:Fe2+ or Zn2+ uptake regulation protein
MTERRTRQLVAIADVVSRSRDHPTAEEVHRRVRRKLPRVSLGTVYRNLDQLAAQQRVRVVQLSDRAARYDGLLEEHDHFLCERCGGVSDLPRERTTQPIRAALRRAGYAVRRHTVTVYGLCPQCGGAKGPGR